MKFARDLNKIPEIGEIVHSRATLHEIHPVKNCVEKLSEKRYPSQYDQYIVELFDNTRAIVSRATMGHLILWGYV